MWCGGAACNYIVISDVTRVIQRGFLLFFPLPFSFSFSIPFGVPGVARTGYHRGGSIRDSDNITPSCGSWLLNACNVRDITRMVGEASKLVNSPLLFGMLFRVMLETTKRTRRIFIFLESFYLSRIFSKNSKKDFFEDSRKFCQIILDII